MHILLEAVFLLICISLFGLWACGWVDNKKEETVAQKMKNWLVGDKCQWGKEDKYHASANPEYRIERFLPAAEIFDKESGARIIVPVDQLYSNRFGCEDKNAKPLGCDHPKENQKRLDNGVWCDFCGAMFFYGGGWNYPTVMPGY